MTQITGEGEKTFEAEAGNETRVVFGRQVGTDW